MKGSVMSKLNMAIIGCGDYVMRWESSSIAASERIRVKSLFDLDEKNAKLLQKKTDGELAESADAIFKDPEISIVCIFVPPWVRKELMIKAAETGKHIITTKPLAPNIEDSRAIVEGADDKVKCAVFYRRTGDPVFVKLKNIYESGEIGKLALYKQDWLHHYPQWNDWALDPEKNGGPFMDAMIHNLNIARYLMGRKTTASVLFTDNHAHPDLKCKDTEFMKVDFEDKGAAHLFITWAADLEVFSLEGNDREHIDIWYMITDQGWRVTVESIEQKSVIIASRNGKKKSWDVEPFEMTPYDAVAASVETNAPMRPDIVSLQEAFEDILLVKQSEASHGTLIELAV